ncbi:MAG: endonuclease MutS2, partial [Bacteroidales bacterium]|nr:endonuclease MutS2 [Bacteroidales bacterium]
MIYPNNFEEKIGFDKIRDLLIDGCISDMGRDWVSKLKFSSHFKSIELWLTQVDEMKVILLGISSFPNSDYFDLRAPLDSIRKEDSRLEQAMMFDLSTSLKVMNSIIKHLEEREKESPQIRIIAKNLITEPFISAELEKIIDDKGEIKDHASDELFEIRKTLKGLLKHNDQIIKDHLKKAIDQGWTNPNTEPAIRDGRVVIPVQAAYKRKIKGFIHGESSTGQTVFIEPAQLFEINNELKELQAAEKRAIVKILIDFATLIRPEIDALIASFNHLGLIDFIIAKARLAIKIEAYKPDLQQSRVIDWQSARHPLLFLSHQAQHKKVIPLDIQLNQNQRILIVSGPNAGGKSVALKTVGLLQYMIQCGLLVPMKPTSFAGLFTHFFIDIGDEQSIENDLSTYSSHLLNMKYFLKHANAKTLFLIDEFGSGTEPNLGGAIAEAILEELNHKKCFGVITTHFANLKLLPSPENGMINGAMLFNTKELEPLYELRIGRPGSSFSVEIAKKIGFPINILKKIESKADRKQ